MGLIKQNHERMTKEENYDDGWIRELLLTFI